MLQNLPHLNENQHEENTWTKQECGTVGESWDSCSDRTGVVPKLEDDLSQATSKQAINKEIQEANNVCIVSNLTVLSNGKNKYILHDISFKAAQGSLVVLSGPVGSGKSSLLSAINQEVAISEGSIFCPGNIAYVPQTPWVFLGTIRENILFGEDFEEERYKTVIEACALQRDIASSPDGDQTIIGERGTTLSGGQQARISLARAVYADADVYLLDDPLSAVDAKVGEHIFQKCICKLLSAKTRIFVSHQVSQMNMADQIILLSKGHVLNQGSFAELSEVLNTIQIGQQKLTPGTQLKSISQDEDQEHGHMEDETRSEVMEMIDDTPLGLGIPEEDRCIGTLSSKIYWKYFRAGMPPVAMVGLAMVFIFAQGMFS